MIVTKNPEEGAGSNYPGNWQFKISHDEKIGFSQEYSAPQTYRGAHIDDPKVPIGQWAHVAVTWTGTEPTWEKCKFYINGELYLPGWWQTHPALTNNEPVRIGRRKDGLYFNGFIGELAIYNVALSADEIKQHYKVGRP